MAGVNDEKKVKLSIWRMILKILSVWRLSPGIYHGASGRVEVKPCMRQWELIPELARASWCLYGLRDTDAHLQQRGRKLLPPSLPLSFISSPLLPFLPYFLPFSFSFSIGFSS